MALALECEPCPGSNPAPTPHAGMKTRFEVERALANLRIKLEGDLDAPADKLHRYQGEIQILRWVLGDLED